MPEGWVFTKPLLFIGDSGRILELIWVGILLGLSMWVLLLIIKIFSK